MNHPGSCRNSLSQQACGCQMAAIADMAVIALD
jgi:hypothetical protein